MDMADLPILLSAICVY